MSSNKKSNSKSTPKSPPKSVAKNGKGDSPRNIFSQKFKSNYDKIDWSKKKS